MKHLVFFLLLFTTNISYSQTIEVVNFNQLEEKWSNDSDTLYLINYWATWCKPCVEELPDFIKINEEMKDEKFKMILVSLDFPKQVASRVIPFVKKKNITSEVVLLDDDPNVWINEVNKDWDGDIPVTQFVKKGEKTFYGTELHYDELKEIINKY